MKIMTSWKLLFGFSHFSKCKTKFKAHNKNAETSICWLSVYGLAEFTTIISTTVGKNLLEEIE